MANKLIQHGGAAAATAAGGPVAGAAWEIGYPIVENWLTGSDPQGDAAKNQQAGMQAAAGQYSSYGQKAQGAREKALAGRLDAYGGAMNATNLLYGTAYDPRVTNPDMYKNPLFTGDQPAPTPMANVPAQQAAVDATIASGSRPRSTPADDRPQTGYDAERTKALQAKTGRSDVWVDGAGIVHQVGATQAGIRLPVVS